MQKDEIGQRWWDGRVNRAELEHLPNIQYANTSCHLTSWLLTEVEEERRGGSPERPSEALDRWPAGGENSCFHFWLWRLPGACLEEKSPAPPTRADGGRISSGEVGFFRISSRKWVMSHAVKDLSSPWLPGTTPPPGSKELPKASY